jgi:hypothetical protein
MALVTNMTLKLSNQPLRELAIRLTQQPLVKKRSFI